MDENVKSANTRMVKRLMLIVISMFVFAIGIMPPLYDVLCEITGLNGKTSNEAADLDGAREIDDDRTVIVQFIADTASDMPWQFKPNTRRLVAHPGQIYQISYKAENPTQRSMIGQAVPSVVPAAATTHFKKTECFCFEQQPLEGGDNVDMPLIFYIDPDLPRSVKEITLSYQLYDITQQVSQL